MKMMTITKLVFRNTIEGNTIIFTLHSWDVIAEDIKPRPGQAKGLLTTNMYLYLE